jgi:mannose-6-phosphate isomerase-like protein (cupin superfamily)
VSPPRTDPDPDRLPEACGREAAGLLRRLLGDDLVAVYLIGSGALGGVAPAVSDVDIVAVCTTALPGERRRAVLDGLATLAMTWPLRGLELVLYAREAVAAPARRPRFEANLNVGPRMPYHLSLDPADEPAHWFLLDLSILRDHGRALAGPPPREVVGPIPRPWLLEAVRDSLAWHQAHEPDLAQSVLNACRGWRFAAEGGWSSKRDAAAWAMARADDPATVEAALAVRAGDRARPLDPARVAAFQARVLAEVERALGLFETRLLAEAPVVTAPDGSAVRPLCVLPAAGSFAHFQLEPGQVARAVSHETVSEIWYVVAGAGRLWRRQVGREDTTVALRPGTCLTIPVGATFQFRAADGGEPLQVVAGTMPPWPLDRPGEARVEQGPWPPTPRPADDAG